MKMLKKGLVSAAAFAALMNAGSICHAEIIAPYGAGQIGYTAVVLCEKLTVRQERSYTSAEVKTLHYGDRLIVMNQKDGWADCVLSDSLDAGPEGWVNADFIVIDPAWYRTDEETPVYAWNDTSALKVAHLDKGTTLPILKDDGNWVVVSLRGAAGWIQKTSADHSVTSGQSQKSSGEEVYWFTVYARDGSSVSIHSIGGAMYEDASGTTYSNSDGFYYYCSANDEVYSTDPNNWSSSASTSTEAAPAASFDVYSRGGECVSIHSVGGAMYEDDYGRTYSNSDGFYYYCIETDEVYSIDQDNWSGN